MDFCRNVSVSGGLPSEYPSQPVTGSLTSSLDDLFSAQNTEVDVSLEWLSIFVEDCFSSTGHSFPATTGAAVAAAAAATKPGMVETEQSKHLHHDFQKKANKPHETKQPLQQFVFPSKARTKRRRKATNTTPTAAMSTKSCWLSSDPPLLQQAYWLADSELIPSPKIKEESGLVTPSAGYKLPKGIEESNEVVKIEFGDKEEEAEDTDGETTMMMVSGGSNDNGGGQTRRCTHCLSQKTPQWRAGPLGPKTLCNACGVRFKSGRLLPEYRPAKSPTFVSYLHSNSHKKVLEMRMVPS